jgi:hypothetical protein
MLNPPNTNGTFLPGDPSRMTDLASLSPDARRIYQELQLAVSRRLKEK